MSATEWKFVPVESDENMATAFFDRVTVTSRGGLIGVRSALNAAIAAAPVPPSVESLLENWTPSDQQAFAKFRDEHFPGEMSSYAIQSLGSAWKDGQANAQPQPAAHLTIPGALEWDGDNGTHGADGESRAHGESAAAIATLKGLGYTHHGGQLWKPPVGQAPRFALIDDLCAQLANTEQSRRSFFDLSQDLEKRLAERDDPCRWSDAQILEFLGVALRNVDPLGTVHLKEIRQGFEYMRDLNRKARSASAEPSDPKCCEPTADELASLAAGDYTPEELWGGSKPTCPKCHKAESIAPADDIPDFTPGNGNKAKRRIAAIQEAKQKTCAACDGWGTISTGIDEAPSTNCKKCDGTGKGGEQ